jgi:hypothetical protein
VLDRVHLNVRREETVIADLFFFGERKRKRERILQRKNAASVAGRSPLYLLDITRR